MSPEIKKGKNNMRQGDWLFTEISEAEFIGKEIEHGKKYIWSEGEATNHFHTIVAEDKKDFSIIKTDYGYLLKVVKEVKATHPEHSLVKDMVVAPGIYKLRQPREYDYIQMQSRTVVD